MIHSVSITPRKLLRVRSTCVTSATRSSRVKFLLSITLKTDILRRPTLKGRSSSGSRITLETIWESKQNLTSTMTRTSFSINLETEDNTINQRHSTKVLENSKIDPHFKVIKEVVTVGEVDTEATTEAEVDITRIERISWESTRIWMTQPITTPGLSKRRKQTNKMIENKSTMETCLTDWNFKISVYQFVCHCFQN